MQWQDMVFTVGSLVFIIALLPSVFSKNKPDIRTSTGTAVILTVFAATYYSLGLYFSAVVTALTAIVWAFLAWQKYSEPASLKR
jgi:hypothetical protein